MTPTDLIKLACDLYPAAEKDLAAKLGVSAPKLRSWRGVTHNRTPRKGHGSSGPSGTYAAPTMDDAERVVAVTRRELQDRTNTLTRELASLARLDG